ncbi:sphingosine-1-phosphate lyase [Heterostelium album PN500]|uniref:sphinganine-1-phosphate aldolase n=1 Tax=Heterostelium pallidum (strain ATCC 26659 / Pp 5 / PN500) TaxID=670386 RepID=D3B6F1_HETP5|nr:sphingosine-1-phosphate lyase [Heterostelium album PN500]EFA82921.1 sphingosine-1-phosphate lyase [Heterostelium album PN500]|eukprot:XP_020435038.1 sphingosine-1-phosphate lyase [Heterostelium album PN500]
MKFDTQKQQHHHHTTIVHQIIIVYYFYTTTTSTTSTTTLSTNIFILYLVNKYNQLSLPFVVKDRMKDLIEATNTYLESYQPLTLVAATAGITAASVALIKTLSDGDFQKNIQKKFFSAVKNVPAVKQEIKKQRSKVKETLKKSFNTDTTNPHYVLPENGVAHSQILAEMQKLMEKDETKWGTSKVSGCVYLGETEHTELLNKAYALFSLSNPLHPGVFPSIRKFETESIAMVANMMNGHPKVVGAMTSGGTESIFMAVKAYRDFYADKTSHPEIVVPVTIHAAFDKACGYLGIKIVHIPFGDDYKVDIAALRKAINKNTIMIAGSAVNFPHGIIDDIETLSKIALEHDIGLHVDACLGGFVIPFAEELGYDIPVFDFRLQGVTSMSVDTHKFGYAAKGTSVVLFGKPKLRRSMYFTAPNWPGGIYASPTMPGSRPGGLVAACWASLVAQGHQGFKSKVESIMQTTKIILKGLKEIEGIQIIGDPKAMVVAFTCENIFFLNDLMSHKGWHLNALQKPDSVHICVTAKHIGMGETFVQDVRDSMKELKSMDKLPTDGMAPIYGTASSVPDRDLIGVILSDFIDTLITPDQQQNKSSASPSEKQQ